MADIKQFVTPDNLGPDFEQDATAKEIKVNIDGVTLIRNAEGKLEAVGDGVGVSKEYVDDLTAVDGTTITRNAEGELESVGGVSKEYVDDLTAVDGTTIIRNAEGELVSVGEVSKEYVDDLTAIDGVTVIRNAEGELVSVGEVSKEYVDDLTAVDGTTIIRNAEGKLEAVGGQGEGRQFWEDVSSSRSSETIYTNTTGRPIMVNVGVPDQPGVYAELHVDNQLVSRAITPDIELSAGLAGEIIQHFETGGSTASAIVPAGGSYAVTGVFDLWMELR